MSFFKEFKEDLSQAVNELLPEENLGGSPMGDEEMVNTLEEEGPEPMMEQLENLLSRTQNGQLAGRSQAAIPAKPAPRPKEPPREDDAGLLDIDADLKALEEELKLNMGMQEEKEETVEIPVPKAPLQETVEAFLDEDVQIVEPIPKAEPVAPKKQPPVQPRPVPARPVAQDEVAVITKGASITGNMESEGSIDIQGKIVGNVECRGKLVITGSVIGDSKSAEFFADSAHIEGEVISTGTVKVGLGSVIIGNITATSAVIAGAVKGDIDVQGPVVVDTSAVIMGNIKSRSVQINNGAVIEGFCSQCYADIDVQGIFGEKR